MYIGFVFLIFLVLVNKLSSDPWLFSIISDDNASPSKQWSKDKEKLSIKSSYYKANLNLVKTKNKNIDYASVYI